MEPKVAEFALQRTNNDLEEAYNIHALFRLEEDEGDTSSDHACNPAARPGREGGGGGRMAPGGARAGLVVGVGEGGGGVRG